MYGREIMTPEGDPGIAIMIGVTAGLVGHFMSPTMVSKPTNLLVLALLSLIAGAAAGLLAAVFRLSLQQAESVPRLSA
jgi:hypothetical protein